MSEPTTRFLVGKREGGKRLDHFLHEKIPGLSRSRIQRAIVERVTVSWGVRARPATPVRPGGEVHVGYTPCPETLLELELPILKRGTGWLAVDKPSGIPVHPVNRVRENSLIRMLRRQEGDERLRLVHRLDRETTGVLLVAEDSETASGLARQFMHGTVRKQYLAVVRGEVAQREGRIEQPIGPASDSRVYVRRAVGPGQSALTEWTLEARGRGVTLLRVFPKTGRRHQIRVHLAAIGHPILGDLLYGRPDRDYLTLVETGRDPRELEDGPRRQLLHCAGLDLDDPHSSGSIEVRSPVPLDFLPAAPGGQWTLGVS